MRSFSLLIMCLLMPSVAYAQRTLDDRDPDTWVTSDSVASAHYDIADAYIRAKQYDRAIPLLEEIYNISPKALFYDKLKESYEAVKRFDDAIAITDDFLTRNPARVDVRTEKARILFLKGNETEALALWENVRLQAPKDEKTYRLLYQSMYRLRLLDKAAATLEKGRAEIGPESLFQTELADIYSLTGAHAKAMEEYLGMLSNNQRQLNYVRNRISRSLEQDGALEASIAVLQRHLRIMPLERSFRELLAWLYMEGKAYRDAFEEYLAIDEMEEQQGLTLFDFARRTAEASAYDISLEAFEAVLMRHPDSSVAAEAHLGIADMHKLWAKSTQEHPFDANGNRQAAPHYDAAIGTYRVFLQQFPDHVLYPDVLHRIGRLQHEVFRTLGEAETTLKEVTERYPDTQAAHNARFDMGRMAITRGKLEEAHSIFSRLTNDLKLGPLAESSRYQQALIQYYRGEFETARALIRMLNENTSTDVANDAIALKVLLIENTGPDSLHTPLRIYAHTSLLLRQHRETEAIASIDTLLGTYGGHPIADDARFLRAQTLHATNHFDEALTAFREIPLMHPQSPLCAPSLFQVAEISEKNDPAGALDTYTELLVRYPGSPLVPITRTRIQSLRDTGG